MFVKQLSQLGWICYRLLGIFFFFNETFRCAHSPKEMQIIGLNWEFLLGIARCTHDPGCFYTHCRCLLVSGTNHLGCSQINGLRILPRSVFKSSPGAADSQRRYIRQGSQQRAQLLVGEEGFRYSLVRTAKPLWLLRNPLQHIMCIMAAQWAFVTSWGRLILGCLVHISHFSLSRAHFLFNTVSSLCISTVSLFMSLPPSP